MTTATRPGYVLDRTGTPRFISRSTAAAWLTSATDGCALQCPDCTAIHDRADDAFDCCQTGAAIPVRPGTDDPDLFETVPAYELAADDAAFAPRLADYDVVLINSSAGKDSQAMLAHLVERADAEGFPRDQIIVVHADLGRVEWKGTRELAEQQAKAYGLRFEVVNRTEDLLDQIVTRRRTLDVEAAILRHESTALSNAGSPALAEIAFEDSNKKLDTPAWPSSQARYCTSDQKTAQVAKLMTRLAADHRATNPGQPIRILNCLGLRADESPARAKKIPFGPDRLASNGRRRVDRWLPIFDWSAEQVWATIHRSGLPYHPAYDAGMPRLSCCFCILSGRRELILSARLNPELAQEYLAVEKQVGHTFKADLSMAEIVEAAALVAA